MKKILLLMLVITLSIFAGPEDYVLVEGGTFLMGNAFDDGEEHEKPTHEVTLYSFYMSKYEVTQKEFSSIMGYNPSQFIGNNNPVEMITWYDAVMYANKLSQKEGKTPYYTVTNIEKIGKHIDRATIKINKDAKGYRLPIEAEWEYAARGGNKSEGYKYSGSNFGEEVAWYVDTIGLNHQPVGKKKANELGIYDMSGNVWEWCFDWYGEYSSTGQINPIGSSNEDYRIIRGGSWFSHEPGATVCERSSFPPNEYYNILGFRLVMSQ